MCHRDTAPLSQGHGDSVATKVCLGTNSCALSYWQWGFTAFTSNGVGFAAANAMQVNVQGCSNEKVPIPTSPWCLSPCSSCPAWRAQSWLLQLLCPPCLSYQPCGSFAPFCQTPHPHCASRSQVPPAPPWLPALTCSVSCPVCSSWDGDLPYIS